VDSGNADNIRHRMLACPWDLETLTPTLIRQGLLTDSEELYIYIYIIYIQATCTYDLKRVHGFCKATGC
jgi:hypothetical protein